MREGSGICAANLHVYMYIYMYMWRIYIYILTLRKKSCSGAREHSLGGLSCHPSRNTYVYINIFIITFVRDVEQQLIQISTQPRHSAQVILLRHSIGWLHQRFRWSSILGLLPWTYYHIRSQLHKKQVFVSKYVICFSGILRIMQNDGLCSAGSHTWKKGERVH